MKTYQKLLEVSEQLIEIQKEFHLELDSLTQRKSTESLSGRPNNRILKEYNGEPSNSQYSFYPFERQFYEELLQEIESQVTVLLTLLEIFEKDFSPKFH